MSDSEENKDSDKEPSDEKSVDPPKVKSVPVPDEFDKDSADSAIVNARERAKAEQRMRKKKKKDRSHPLDGFSPLKKSDGNGFFGCIIAALSFAFVLIVAAIIGLYWWAIRPYKEAGYEIISESENGFIIFTEAPEVESLVFVWEVEYLAPSTPKRIVFVGDTVTLSGTFEEKVVFRGKKLILEEGTVFRKDLEVYGAEMIDRGATVEGETQGSVMSQSKEKPEAPPEPEEPDAEPKDEPTG